MAVLIAASIPIHMDRQRLRLAQTLSAELGRQVTVGEVHLRLLPKPGFNIDGPFIVSDDPSFSPEPLLRADSVRADLRLASLWQGRIEIASISLEAPNINLVRSESGHWNLESLLLRASQIPSAPTSQPRATERPRFPYINASDARINFKNGIVRSVFAFTESELSFWLESDNRWNARFEGKPVRTDVPIADTGTVRFRGRFGRAPSLGTTPFDGVLEVHDAQLGQLSKLLVAHDAGWRGALDGELSASGTLARLTFANKIRIHQFRRFDIATGDTLNLSADCSGVLTYSVQAQGPTRNLENLSCTVPLDSGKIQLSGSVSHDLAATLYNLRLGTERVPLAAVAAVYRNLQPNVPDDFRAEGEMNGDFLMTQSGIDGAGKIERLSVNSSRLSSPIRIEEPVLLRSISDGKVQSIAFGPLQVPSIGGLTGSFGADGFLFNLDAETEVPSLLRLGQTFGIDAPLRVESGRATGIVHVAGTWSGFHYTSVSGDLDLTNIVMFPSPAQVLLHSANVSLNQTSAIIRTTAGEVPSASLNFSGAAELARPCGSPLDCSATFDLSIDKVDLPKLQKAVNANSGFLTSLLNRDSWYDRNLDTLERLNLTGKLRIANVHTPKFALEQCSATLALHGGILKMTNFEARYSGGTVSGTENTIALLPGEPKYTLNLQLARLPIAPLLPSSPPSQGTWNSRLQLSMTGQSLDDLKQSAEGTVRFDLANGALNTDAGDFSFRRITGEAQIAKQRLSLANNVLAIPLTGKAWQVEGNADFARRVDPKFTRGPEHFDLNGQLTSASKIP
ncbi:MAG: AsmA family protein [Acidobacteriales bacterium]|nr:AsmA family protein [Terriglobales bacterium]